MSEKANIEAIRKAAEASEVAYKRAEAVNFDPCAEETLSYHFEREDFVDEVEKLGTSELCRLAEIGECFVHDRPGEAKRAKMLRLTDAYFIAHGGQKTLEEREK